MRSVVNSIYKFKWSYPCIISVNQEEEHAGQHVDIQKYVEDQFKDFENCLQILSHIHISYDSS